MLSPCQINTQIEESSLKGLRLSSSGHYMSQNVVIPTVKGLYLCEGHIGFSNQKTDLMAIFDGIRPSKYPYIHSQFIVYARLNQGLGKVPFYIEVRLAASQQLVHVTKTNQLYFPDRDKLVEMVMTMKDVSFPKPGLYLVELHCDAQWVADTTLELL